MIAAPVLWSTAGVVTRHVERAGAFEQVFWRSLFALVFVMGFLVFRKSSPARAVRDAGWPGLASGVLWAVMFTAFMLALSLTTTANALVVMSVSPLLTALLARAFLRDPFGLGKVRRDLRRVLAHAPHAQQADIERRVGWKPRPAAARFRGRRLGKSHGFAGPCRTRQR